MSTMAGVCGNHPSPKAFGPDARLRCRAHLDAVRQEGVNLPCRYCVIVVLKTPPDGSCRTAFLISRRFDLSAVVRNRARRLLRECWRTLLPSLSPCWVLMIPRRPIKGVKLGQLLPEVSRLFRKSGTLAVSREETAADSGAGQGK
ncbi:MAG: ribonuclease P protein component [Oligosphaeraceae bacterium]